MTTPISGPPAPSSPRVPVHPILSPFGRFHLHTFFLDTPEPAIVDTGIASSPVQAMAPALRDLGRDIRDVRWILLTHGHIDHIGGAHALWELTGRRAKIVIHEGDVHLLRSRRAHVEDYLTGRGCYLHDPDGEAHQTQGASTVISGELEPTVLLRGGETLDLGGVALTVHSIPGHTPGSVAYVLDDQGDVFVGDAVQIHGAANGFPGFADPVGYRDSIEHLRAQIRPRRIFLGHPYRRADGTAYGPVLDATQAEAALRESLDIEAQVRAAATDYLAEGIRPSESPYSPFEAVAGRLGYRGDPTLEPSPFFTTLHGYATQGATTDG